MPAKFICMSESDSHTYNVGRAGVCSDRETWPQYMTKLLDCLKELSRSASLSSLPSFPHTESPSFEEPASPQTPTKPSVPMNLSHSMGHSSTLNLGSSMRSSRVVPRRTSLQIKGPYHLKKTPSYIVRSLRPFSFCGDQSTKDIVLVTTFCW